MPKPSPEALTVVRLDDSGRTVSVSAGREAMLNM